MANEFDVAWHTITDNLCLVNEADKLEINKYFETANFI